MTMTTDEVILWLDANARRYAQKHGVTMDRDYLMMKLMEEIGEFAQATLVYENKCRVKKRIDKEVAREQMASELGDVLAVVLSLAIEMKIDVFAEMEKKALDKGKRFLEKR
ncbi:MAG: hypothetical protein O2877_01030 [bacterium]|nr:hypothetical protein [bacterium]